jgi:HEAT repeat protein
MDRQKRRPDVNWTPPWRNVVHAAAASQPGGWPGLGNTVPLPGRLDPIRGNANIALGNIGDPAAVDILGWTLGHETAQIRADSAWSLGRIGGAQARVTLEKARTREKEPMMAPEIGDALATQDV